MAMKCKVSVIVPLYNVRTKMLKTLEALKSQTFDDFEVIFVDDGSLDDSSDYADEYLKDTDVKYTIIRKENGGVSSARNVGLDNASGEYIMFLDSDDYIEKDMISDLYNKASEKEYDVVYSSYKFENPDGTLIYDNIDTLKEGEYSGKDSAVGFIYGTSQTHIMATLFKKKLIIDNNLKFDVNRKYAEDTAFEIKCYAHASKVYCVKHSYAHYVKYDTSAVNTISQRFEDVYYSNIETLEYIKKYIKDKEIENALIKYRIPVAVVYIFSCFSMKSELYAELDKFIKDDKVRYYLRKCGLYKIEKDRVKYYILAKMILCMPELLKKYYLNK